MPRHELLHHFLVKNTCFSKLLKKKGNKTDSMNHQPTVYGFILLSLFTGKIQELSRT